MPESLIPHVRRLGVRAPSQEQVKTEQTEKSTMLLGPIKEGRTQSKPLILRLKGQMVNTGRSSLREQRLTGGNH